MKRIFLFMTFMVIAGVALLTSCSEDDEATVSSYTIEVENLTMSGSDTDAALQYMNNVSAAYQKAVGITNGESIKLDGSVSQNASSLKTKFDATTLPTNAPEASVCTYSFTIVLAGYDNTARTTIASRTFSNK